MGTNDDSEGLKLRDLALELYKDDKIFQASRCEKELAEKFPGVHGNSLDLLAPLRKTAEEAYRFHEEFSTTEGWKCVRQGKDAADVSVWIRQEAGSEMHTLRIEGEAAAPLEYLLVLQNEITLYDKWLPFIGGSRLLARQSRCEREAWLKVWSPMPAIFHHRDSCIYGRAFDGLDEEGFVLVLIRSLTDTDAVGGPLPPVEPRTTRVNISYGGIEMFPLSQGRTRIRAIALVDPKIAVLPSWLINWVSTKVCYVGLRVWESRARKLQEADEDCPHKQRMRDDAEFYSWVIARVRSRTDKLPAEPGAGEAIPAAVTADDGAGEPIPAAVKADDGAGEAIPAAVTADDGAGEPIPAAVKADDGADPVKI